MATALKDFGSLLRNTDVSTPEGLTWILLQLSCGALQENAMLKSRIDSLEDEIAALAERVGDVEKNTSVTINYHYGH